MATAFAVYCVDDGSLSFYKRDSVPEVGSEFEGKIVREIYTGFEESEYVNSSYVPWSDNKSIITNVTFVDTITPISTAHWFIGFGKLISIDLTNLNTSNVTNMTGMFSNCQVLTSLNLSSFNTSNVTNMSNMFYNCYALTTLDLSNFNTSSVTTMSQMFYNCYALTTLDLSNWDTSDVTSMTSMFSNCEALTTLNLSNFDTSKVTSMISMFSNCNALTAIIVSDTWSTANVTNGINMFANCTNLRGAVQFDSTKIDHTMANYETGYLTLRIAPNYFINEKTITNLSNAVRKVVNTSDRLYFSDMINILNDLKTMSEYDEETGNVSLFIGVDINK